MIDAGTGVGRTIERPELLDGVERLDILLTHFHLDHVAGLAYLPAVGLCPQTTIWGPGALLYGTATEAILGTVSHEPFHPVPLEDQDLVVRDIPPGEFELAGVRVGSRRQDRHSAPSLGFRFDDTLAAGCATLAHEAWFTTADPRNVEIHSAAAQAAQVAVDAGIEQLLLIHLPPFEQSFDAIVEEARTRAPLAEPAIDGAGLSMLVG